MQLSVLHISDLHREAGHPIGNPILLESLKRDRDRYTLHESRPITPPDLIIVSGDLVQGVRHGTPDAEAILYTQYQEASNFLTSLVDEFLQGDKQKIIIVPGNHDVSDSHVRQSLTPISMDVGPSTKRGFVAELYTPESPLRWSWEEFELYRVASPDLYKERFTPFVDFYNTFYDGHHSYTTDPGQQFGVFSFPQWDLAIVGFCSSYNNDLLNRQAAIHPDCIARAGEFLRTGPIQSSLRIAVWHHNIEGSPFQVDYLDPDTVQNFIDGGFSLGFHGHQHKPQHIDTRFRYGSDRRITLISAGTLCGNAAYGFRRAYNIVELDTATASGFLHVREMQNDRLHMPIWGPSSLAPHMDGPLRFEYDPPLQPTVHLQYQHTIELLRTALQKYEVHNYDAAAAILKPIAQYDATARRLLLDCLIEGANTSELVSTFDPPQSTSEAIALMDALWVEGAKERLIELLNSPLLSHSDDPSVAAMKTKYKARLEL